MERLPIEYLKIMSFNLRYANYEKFENAYLNGELPKEATVHFMYAIRSVFIFYWKYIKYCYKNKGVDLHTPRQVLLRAKEDNLIQDADTWLDWIESYNTMYWEEDSGRKDNFTDLLVKNFHNKVSSTLNFMRTPERSEIFEKYKSVEEEIIKEELKLADNEPEFNPDDLGLTQYEYETLLNAFKTTPEIERVWAHGSRLYKTDYLGSDCDLIVDCPKENAKEIYAKLYNLPLPFIVDSKNINVEDDAVYIKTIMDLGTKLIYVK